MKIAIIAFSNPIYCPYINFYTDILDNIKDCSYDVIFLKRFKNDDSSYKSNFFPITWVGKGTNSAGKLQKLFNFFIFRNKVTHLLAKRNYDKIIVLTTWPAVLLGRFLQKKFLNRYLVDIRDYTKENNRLFYWLESNVLKYSALNVVSSKGYLTFLPKADYVVCHNMNHQIKSEDNSIAFNKREKIVISYIGLISYVDKCIQLINLVENDDRFCFYFYGNESGKPIISEYVQNLNNDRIRFFGTFQPDEKPKIYKNSDVVFNCYGNETDLVRCAISNKYYDGALYRRPLLVSPNTIMSELGGEFAFPIDLDNVYSLDALYDWYKKIDFLSYDEYAKKLIENCRHENNITINKIIDAIK